jgi:hypothetical protein
MSDRRDQDSTDEPTAVMARHREGPDGRCIACRVIWPCGPWVEAREAWDASEEARYE